MNPLNLIIQPSTVYHFAELLNKPFNQYAAYTSGLIDNNGQITKKNGSMDGLEYIAIRMKSFLKDLMPGSTKFFLQSLSGTLKLFNEELNQMGINRDSANMVLECYLLGITEGKVSYLDYLLEEAQVRYITEEMGAGAAGGMGSPAHTDLQGGIGGIDRPMGLMFRRKNKKRRNKSSEIVEANMEAPQQKANPYLPIQVDPLYYDELTRSLAPGGELDFDQITTPELQKYLKRLGERSKSKTVYVIGNNTQPPMQLNLNRSRKSSKKSS
jgi:hypothetical protein